MILKIISHCNERPSCVLTESVLSFEVSWTRVLNYHHKAPSWFLLVPKLHSVKTWADVRGGVRWKETCKSLLLCRFTEFKVSMFFLIPYIDAVATCAEPNCISSTYLLFNKPGHWRDIWFRRRTVCMGGSSIFPRTGCTRFLLYFNTNKPHSFSFCRIPVVLENRRSSQGGCAPPAPSP